MAKSKEDKSNKKSKLNGLLNLFGLSVKQNTKDPLDRIKPTKKVIDPKTGNQKIHPDVFNDDIKKIYNWWVNDCHDKADDWQNRLALWKDMDMLYYNSSLIARAIDLIADEVVQADTHDQPIQVEAKRPVKKFILELFDKVDVYTKIRPIALDTIQFGNAGVIIGLDDTGVSDLIHVDTKVLKDRLEFTPYKVEVEKKKGNSFLNNYCNDVKRIDAMVNSMTNKDDITSYYKSYLLGFEVGKNILPPWRFLHFRNLTSKSPFAPFGIPMFIHAIAPYRQYDASMTMQIIARTARFPKNIYSMKLPNVMNPTEKVISAIEMLNQIQNSGLKGTQKEEFGVAENIVTIEDLYDYKQETADIDLGKVDDIEMLKDDLIIATAIPRNLIDPNDGGFGDSGVSLIEKWKPFARIVYRFQQSILEQITKLVKIHMIQSGKFKPDEVDFILSMPYPETMTNDDIIQNQTSLADLAGEIIELLSNRLNEDEPLPAELTKSIISKFLPYEDATMDSWYKIIDKAKKNDDGEEDEDENEDGEEGDVEENIDKELKRIKEILNIQDRVKVSKDYRKLSEGLTNKKELKLKSLKEHIEDATFDAKQVQKREGVFNGHHYYSSRHQLDDFDPMSLLALDKQILKEKYDRKDKSIYRAEKVVKSPILTKDKKKLKEDKKK